MYIKRNNEIIITDLCDFNTSQIFDCGQIFRYFIGENIACVVSKDKFALLINDNNQVIIKTKDVDYFEQFFDLATDYSSIKSELSKDTFLKPCCKYGYGIRILKQDLFEMIISFIVSANNNIKRIKNSLNFISKRFGSKIQIDKDLIQDLFTDKDMNASSCEDYKLEDFLASNPLIEKEKDDYYYYAFPTLEQLKTISIQDFVDAGLGYRASQMHDTVQKLNKEDLNNFYILSFDEQMKFLLSLKGVGEKVANCIMLFAGVSTRMFPVDTWINKVYNALTNTSDKNRKEINKELIDRYKDLSGYAQQYFFYYYRENKLT